MFKPFCLIKLFLYLLALKTYLLLKKHFLFLNIWYNAFGVGDMNIKIDVNENFEEEIIIRCKKISPLVQDVQNAILDITSSCKTLLVYKDESEYYLPVDNILFFETSENRISAHTNNDIYYVKYRLYELEEKLPKYFLRISKSTIVNINQIFGITRTITSPNIIQFYNSHKQVYVSRFYFKNLKSRLEERR